MASLPTPIIRTHHGDACRVAVLAHPHVILQARRWRSMHWDRDTGRYLAYRLAAYVVLNLGEDVAMAAFLFC